MTTPLRASLALIALFLAAGSIAAAGCGDDDGGDSQPAAASEAAGASSGASAEDAEAVVREYMVAAAKGDGETACALFAEEGLREMQRSLPKTGDDAPTCQEVFELIGEAGAESFDVGGRAVPVDELDSIELDVEVGDDGTAEVTPAGERQSMALELVGGKWRITGFPGAGADE